MLRVKMFGRSGSKIRIFGSPGKRRSAVLFTLSGVPALVLLAVLKSSNIAYESGADFVLGIYGPLAILIGGIAWLAARRGVVFDSVSRTATQGKTISPYDEFSAVRLTKKIVREARYRSDGPTTYEDVTYYCIDLIRVDRSYDIGDVALGSASPEGVDLFLALPGWSVVMHTDELQVWRLSERIARELQVLHVDAIGAPAVTRFASELDTPMVELVGKRIPVPPASSENEEDAIVEIDGSKTVLHFTSQNAWIDLCIGLAVLSVLAAVIAYFLELSPLLYSGLGGFPVFALAALAMHLRPRMAQVRVDSERVCFAQGWGPKRCMRMKVLESIRIENHLAISLLSDHRIVRCVMFSEVGVDWLRDEIVRAMARTRGIETTGPYR